MPFKKNRTLDAGDYEAVHTGITEKESRDGDLFKIWNFEVQTPDGPVELSGTSSLNSGPSSKPFQWARAILGRAPTPDEFDDDLAVLEGRRCRLVVDIGDNGFATITSILPPAAPAGSAQAMIDRLATQATLDDLPPEIGEAS
jgi:hypothetical protein